MPLVKYFLGEAYKLRGFFTQIKIKITNKGLGLTCSTTERITSKNTNKPKSQSQYFNHYLIIFSKNVDLDF